ncbi:MAG: multiprotein bridging factor aMBF1 [bacterium]
MICELCGKEQERTTSVQIEGTYLRVCKECARFGDTVKPGAKTGGAQAQTVIAARLENRERRMKTRDVYSTGEEVSELAEDYPHRIREAREALGWKQEELAVKMSEKISVIMKAERGELRPNDTLVKRFEKTLGIHLMEKVPLIKPEKTGVNKTLTLADFIKKD